MSNSLKMDKLVWRKKDIKNIVLVFIGAILSAIGLNVFVASKDLLPSGFTGVAILIVRIAHEFFNINMSFSIVYLLLNFFPAIFVYKYIGRKFTILSVLHIVLVSFFTSIIPHVAITDDTLIVCIFGGIFVGSGTLTSLKANACSGGTDFIAMYISQRYNRSVWNYVFLFNVMLLIISGVLFGVEPALYSIIYQFTNTQIVNTFHDRYHLRALTIITKMPNEVSEAIFNCSRRGITEWSAKGKYANTNQSVLYMVVGADEVSRIIKGIRKVDTHVFISDVKINQVVGNFYQKPFE